MDLKFLWILKLIVILIEMCCGHPTGYSYTRFIGPVSGPEHKVLVKDGHSGPNNVDYIAKPDYHFAYGVDDAKTRVLQNRKETRHGDIVKGEYSVVDPDGTLRVVKYTADDINGFQAEIFTNGQSSVGHGHNKDDLNDSAKQIDNNSNKQNNQDNTNTQYHHTNHVHDDNNENKSNGRRVKDSSNETNNNNDDNNTNEHEDTHDEQIDYDEQNEDNRNNANYDDDDNDDNNDSDDGNDDTETHDNDNENHNDEYRYNQSDNDNIHSFENGFFRF